MNVTSKKSAVIAIAAVIATGCSARADDSGKLKQDLQALQHQNDALQQRVNKLEQKQASQPGAPAGSDAFLAQAANGPIKALTGDGPLTWNGITFYGALDIGLGWQSHGLPSNSYIYGPATMIGRNNNHSYFGLGYNALQFTTLGVKGEHEILPGISGVFNASTGFIPTSGQLADAPKSLIQQNGVNRLNYTNSADGSRAGQAFNDQLYLGLSSKTFGALTFGRQRSLSFDAIIAYDPNASSGAFSPIGISGAAAGGGYTENARWDNALKYKLAYGPVHFGAMYKFADGSGGSNVGNGNVAVLSYPSKNYGYQFNLGGEVQNLALDAVAGYYNQAVSAAPLSAAQLAGASTFISNANIVTATIGNANTNTLAGTVSDTTNVLVAAKYTYEQFKFFLGYEYVLFTNPKDSLGIGGQTQGGYALSSVNNHPYGSNRSQNYLWGGVRYAFSPQIELVAGYYHIWQNTYTGAVAGSTRTIAACTNNATPNCAGALDVVGFYSDYHFNKHFDVYAGMMYSSVTNGMASGFLYHVEWAPTVGIRYVF